MNPQQISKLWSVVGGVLLYYALNSWLVSQGGNEIFGVKLVHSGRVPVAMLAILICAVLLIAASLIGRLFARRAASSWYERIPVVGFDAIRTGSPEGRIYQLAMMVLLSLIPSLSLIHFWLVFTAGKVVTTGSNARVASGIWDISALQGVNDPARICADLAAGPSIACENGTTFFPIVEPLILAVITIVAFLATVAHWLSVFFQGQREQLANAKPQK